MSLELFPHSSPRPKKVQGHESPCAPVAIYRFRTPEPEKSPIRKLLIVLRQSRVLTQRCSHLEDVILMVPIVGMVIYYLGTEVRKYGPEEQQTNTACGDYRHYDIACRVHREGGSSGSGSRDLDQAAIRRGIASSNTQKCAVMRREGIFKAMQSCQETSERGDDCVRLNSLDVNMTHQSMISASRRSEAERRKERY
ncbi:hypothetical protein B566_EDAN011172 [Ephemera danica]|nr:hypothetical protein B566_EDAN011172 [Ephemera danica]